MTLEVIKQGDPLEAARVLKVDNIVAIALRCQKDDIRAAIEWLERDWDRQRADREERRAKWDKGRRAWESKIRADNPQVITLPKYQIKPPHLNTASMNRVRRAIEKLTAKENKSA